MSLRVLKIITSLHFHILLPVVLLAASVLRYNALSFMYLVCLLISPLLRSPTKISLKGPTGIFLKCLIPVSLLPILGHIIFHITLVAIATDKEPYGHMFTNCSSTEKLVRQIGYQRLDRADVWDIIRLVVPDAILFIIAVVTLVLSVKLSNREADISTSLSETPLLGGVKKKASHQFLKLLLECLQNVVLLAAGVFVPSVLGGVYFIVFLILLTMWGCYKSLGPQFAYVRIMLLIYTGSHILLLHLYQFQFFQDALPPSDLIARIVGLTGVVKTDCGDVDRIVFHHGIRWSVFVNPGILLILYWFFALNTVLWRRKMQDLEDSPKRSGKRQSTASGERQLNWSDDKHQFDNETGSMVFSGSFIGDDEPGEDERLVEHEEPPGGLYGGVNDTPGSFGSELEAGEGQSPQGPPASDSASQLKRRPWMSVLFLIMRQSYVLSLIAMMAWSITYHSWLTFAFLLAACILWMLPNSRDWCLRTSPFILVYAELLLLGQYIFCMNLDSELPKMAGSYKLDEIGLKRFLDPCLNMALQAFYTLFIVLTMRQFLGERSISAANTTDIKMQTRARKISFLDKLLPSGVSFEVPVDMQHQTYDSKTMLFIGHFLWLLLCKYWIFFCTIMMAVISLQDVVIYRIIYMILFLIFIVLFQVNFTVWRGINFIFWWVVVLYSMFVLTLIYTYQFEEFHNYWSNFTGFKDDVLKDIGLERYDTAGLFVKLLTPTSFLVFVILQLRYFHAPFLKLSATDRYRTVPDTSNATRSDDERNIQNITEDEEEILSDEESKPRDCSWRNWMKKKILAGAELWNRLTLFLWRLGEIHAFKLVTLIIIIVSVNEVSALTAIYVLLVAILLPLPRASLLLSHLILLWTTVIILAKMIFQLNLVDTDYWKTSCQVKPNSTSAGNVTDNAIWFGLEKIKPRDIAISYYTRLYILILVLIVCESIIRYHQRQYYKNPVIVRPARGILFSTITRADADKGIISCIKFFANYFFYKFGLECCYIMTAVVVCVRVDAVALIYIILVAIIMMMSRRTVASLWPIYKLILAILLAVQFLVVLGFPLGACIQYPWSSNSNIRPNLKQWLYLPDYVRPPHSIVLIADFLQLLFVSLQAFVFSIEANHEKMQSYGGGDNADILADVEQNKPIPCKDFTLEQTKGIDILKYLVFENMFWLTMAIIFITGATRINIFSLFYVIAVFCFMWFGKEFFLKPLRSMLRMWNWLVGYCILVMFFKTALQLVGCVYVDTLVEEHQCWLVQLFGVNCLLSNADKVSNSKCYVEKDDAGLAWDVVCLTFLLLQRRVYSSHYFRHIVDTIQAQNNLVSKGAELINRIMIREVNKQNEQERDILANIKKQMKMLKKKQTDVTKDYKEPEEHFQAIRAGDYYLFEHEEENKDQVTSLTYGTDSKDVDTTPTPLQVVNTAYDQDIKTAVETYPSVSADEEDKKKECDEEPASVSTLWTVLNFILTLWYSFIDWLIRLCNRLSRNYRLVAKKLSKELVIEKAKILSTKDTRHDGEQASEQDIRLDIEDTAGPSEPVATTTLSKTLSASMLRPSWTQLSLDELEKQDEEEINQQFKDNSHRFRRLVTAFSLLLASRSEILCYFLMILDQMVYGSLLSLPLPLMVFLWGMLSVPRPSKTFWVTIITYTEAVVVCKYLFQFGFFPWNDGTIYDGPFFPPRIIGIEKTSHYANVDIVLLLALFLHRSILRKYGLWRDAADITADMEAAESKEQSAPNSPEQRAIDGDSYFKESDTEQSASTETTEPRSKLGQGLSYIVKPFTKFFKQVTQSSYNATADVYAQMFFCDFILFLVLVFGFSSFGPADTTGDENVTSYLEDNKIPVPFLVMLITQFIFIIIDRAIFLRKFVLGKFIFQILLVILIHVWMFFVLPAITRKSFFDNTPAQIWYFIKCIYFGLSAYQIRCGYPNRILGNFLTKKYGYTNLILFKGFLTIPFLLELRALMDWIWTDSTLAIGNWLQMEDIYANIFVLKCWREIEKTYPQERAIKKSVVSKYLVGGILLVVIIFIIWFPLVFFSFFNSVFIKNPPYEASITVGITGYQPLFTTTAQGGTIVPLTDAQFSMLKKHYSKDRNANSFLSGYDKEDVTMISFDGRSLSIWGISPVSQTALADDLAGNSTSKIALTVEMKFSREPDKSLPGEVTNTFELDLRHLDDDNTYVPSNISGIIRGTYNGTCKVFNVFPRFVRLAGQSKAMELDQLIYGSYGMGKSNISLQLQSEPSKGLSEWWNVNETVKGSSIFDYNTAETVQFPKIFVVTFNDRKAPASLSFLSGYGIIGLYISFILLIGRLLRLSTTNQYLTIMFRELPDVNRLLQLCLDIYLVREMKEYHLEEDLYAKLIFLYRSPETTISFTRQTVRIGNIKKKSDEKKKDD